MKKKLYTLMVSVMVVTMICLSGTARGVDYVFEEIVIPGASDSVAYGINATTVVGKFYDQTGRHGFSYDIATGIAVPLDVPGPDVVETVATGINGAGIVVGYFRDRFLGRSAFYYDGSYTPIVSPPGAWMAMAYDINSGGVAAGAYISFPMFEGVGFLYDIPSDVYENFQQGFYTNALGINDAGGVVGSIWQEPEDPVLPSYDQFGFFRDPTGSIIEIKYLDIDTCFYTDTWDINNSGDILGNFSCYSGINGHGGFLINTGAFPDYVDADFDVIVLSGSPLPSAFYWVYYGINDDGTIVGGYMDSTGWHAFMATPVP
jgi:uncharacterized membrane protein